MPEKILIFGGSFDPPHEGHKALLSAALEFLKPDLALVVPAYQAPLKSAPSAPADDRLRLTRLGLWAPLPRRWRKITRVDSGEIAARRRVYTYETLRRLKKKHHGAEFHFVVGEDAAARFHLWKNQKELKNSCRWWGAARPGAAARGFGQSAPRFFGKIPGRMPDISSTEVRAALALGQNAGAALTKPVAHDIKSRGLYGGAFLAELEKSLSPERFAHTLAVAKLAQELAARWNADQDDARWAGLLHDWGRSVPIPKMPDYARRRGLKIPELDGIISHQPLLLHAYISEDLAKRAKLAGPEVLRAVRQHTLGGRRMSLLDKILYVADSCSPDRTYPGAAARRRQAFSDIELAFRDCVRSKITHALSRGSWIHPLTISLWNAFVD